MSSQTDIVDQDFRNFLDLDLELNITDFQNRRRRLIIGSYLQFVGIRTLQYRSRGPYVG
jgi:hypothetical protein